MQLMKFKTGPDQYSSGQNEAKFTYKYEMIRDDWLDCIDQISRFCHYLLTALIRVTTQ